jgi:UDP-N-acetylglucosamine 2-epimerase (non-hydrolysing)/UDP-GlcNAc3NAcA epimerase
MVNLRKEGLEDRAHYIGNLMEVSFAKNIARPRVLWLQNLAYPAWQRILLPPKFYLLTCHRQENANEKNLTEILLAMENANYPVIYPVHPRNTERVLKIYREHNLQNVFLTEPAGYLDSIHLINNAVAVVTDSGGVLQEAHFAQTPYVFVLDIPRVPENTRFDVNRLAKPERQDILAKLNTPQQFAAKREQFGTNQRQQYDASLSRQCDAGEMLDPQNIAAFEENVLKIFREFEEG